MPKIPEGAKKPSDRLAAEATAPTTADETVGIPLGGVPIRVLPMGQWKKWAQTALRNGDLDKWGTGAVHPDDLQAYLDADVTNDEVGEWLDAWGESVGLQAGEARAS